MTYNTSVEEVHSGTYLTNAMLGNRRSSNGCRALLVNRSAGIPAQPSNKLRARHKGRDCSLLSCTVDDIQYVDGGRAFRHFPAERGGLAMEELLQ